METIIGFGLGTLLGVIIAIILGWSNCWRIFGIKGWSRISYSIWNAGFQIGFSSNECSSPWIYISNYV